MASYSSGLYALANAQAQEEGFFVPGSLPARSNNPGDLTSSGGTLQTYGSLQDGWNALYSKLDNIRQGLSTVYSPSMTLGQFESTYTGGDPNAASNVSSILGQGTTSSTSLADIFNRGSSAMQSGQGLAGQVGSQLDVAKQLSIGPEWISRGVAIVAGLVLIAGAVFGFDNVKETVVSVARTGAEVAA